ncbi:hypothetical protein FOQG_00986 [Fusarium oxysporum f. sp. raphani 54005]|uniref:Uncharacterized protein n=7 Tax=Fusarium oxysporum TaxID=5507 RepID=W9ISY2_FUSOX|nr:hypothetical protein FOXG_18243 [Fusarium oxysporum f. sp. lycopersici 4287]EWY98063.1 hypothetical protein FOYG_02728 [Fusarium oxysporum NRRL 32931]EWZ44135.1 hypothetical protein FOZG_05064 [Fusarium oxysporum Fo47]EXA49420.1 hypothetical protein FOVG_02595 [Fusarium oxysporum f. sp. pisi HDV247]EXK41501.1 hypothetical protein FOMG_04893 [Fusarium oxysporum f. sp. melonis 26406]EXL01147.1 hypothetical protein FOQG_00986 [Fusarium oxysporum f. sp. raphani 54005]EXL61470.1 hypothetical pr
MSRSKQGELGEEKSRQLRGEKKNNTAQWSTAKSR